jgi:hypothetical protein
VLVTHFQPIFLDVGMEGVFARDFLSDCEQRAAQQPLVIKTGVAARFACGLLRVEAVNQMVQSLKGKADDCVCREWDWRMGIGLRPVVDRGRMRCRLRTVRS